MAKAPSLQSFVENEWITEVLQPLQSGKEATAYCCRAHPSRGYTLLVAKVYTNPEFRSFSNDAQYREGFYIADTRLRRAARNHTQVGKRVDFHMWLENEYKTLKTLHAVGADVPKPLARCENAILMEYCGDADGPAPQLNRVTLEVNEAHRLYSRTMRNIRLWLKNHLIHADLSPFNILYWNGFITVIDFPQAVDAELNSQAYKFLQRDIDNVCKHFQKYGVKCHSWRIADTMWEQYLNGDL